MAKQSKGLEAERVSADELKRAVVEQAENGFMGMLVVQGQGAIKIQTEGGAYPLPDADYVILMLPTATDDKRVAWLAVKDGTEE